MMFCSFVVEMLLLFIVMCTPMSSKEQLYELQRTVTTLEPGPSYWQYSLVQENWLSNVTARTWVTLGGSEQKKLHYPLVTCIQKRQRTNFTAPGCIIGSAEALPILCVRCSRWERKKESRIQRERERERDTERERERERERDGRDVTIIVLKLAMSLHFPLPKIRTWRWVYTFPCQKFALLVSPFTLPISPFLNGHHCGAEIHIEFSLSVAKKFRPLCSDSLKWRDCSSHRKNESN